MKRFLTLFGLISLGLIIENFPWSDRNINYLSRLIKSEDQLIKGKLSRLTSVNRNFSFSYKSNFKGHINRLSISSVVLNKVNFSEAVVQGSSVKKERFSQNSQENICAKVSFLIKLQASACNFIKKETLTQAWILRNF